MKKLILLSTFLFLMISGINAQEKKDTINQEIQILDSINKEIDSLNIAFKHKMSAKCPDTLLRCYLLVTKGNGKNIKCIYGFVAIDACTGIENYFDEKMRRIKDKYIFLHSIAR